MNSKRTRIVAATCLAAGLLLSTTAAPTTAGVVPWVWNALFGPSCPGMSCGGCQLTSCGNCYQRSPTYQAPVYSSPAYSMPAYSQPVYSQPVYSAPSYSVPQYSAPQYSVPQYSPTYSVPDSSCPSCTTPAYSAPVYTPSTGFYNGGMINGEMIVGGGEIVSGGEIMSGYAPYGETIISGPVMDGSYNSQPYIGNTYVQPSCNQCGITYPDNGTVISGPVIDTTVPSINSVEPEPETDPMDNGYSKDTLDAVGSTKDRDDGNSLDESPLMNDDDEGLGGGFIDDMPTRRRNRGGYDESEFEDPVPVNERFKITDPAGDAGTSGDAEASDGVDAGDGAGSGFESDMDSEFDSGIESGLDGDLDSPIDMPLDDEFERSSFRDDSDPMTQHQALPLETQVPVHATVQLVRTMTSRSKLQLPASDSVVLNNTKQTPVRWISAPRTSRMR